MKPEKFLEHLRGYEEEKKKTGLKYHGYENGSVSIHRSGDTTGDYFNIFSDGTARCENRSVCHFLNRNKINICDIPDFDDYELYTLDLIPLCGYITLTDINPDSIDDVRTVITKLFDRVVVETSEYLIDDMYAQYQRDYRGYCDTFVFGAKTTNIPVIVHVCSINELIKENTSRSHYDVKPLPFIKGMDKRKSFYVYFSSFSAGVIKDTSKTRYNCNLALKELCDHFDKLHIPYKFTAMKMKNWIYY